MKSFPLKMVWTIVVVAFLMLAMFYKTPNWSLGGKLNSNFSIFLSKKYK